MNPLAPYFAMGKLIALLGAVALICWQSSAIHRARENVRHCNEAKAVLQAKLDELGEQSKQQQQAVTKTVDHYITVTKPQLIREREKIESAPLPGNCRTPQEVLNADI